MVEEGRQAAPLSGAPQALTLQSPLRPHREAGGSGPCLEATTRSLMGVAWPSPFSLLQPFSPEGSLGEDSCSMSPSPFRAESADASPSSPAAGNSARSQGLSPPSHPDVCGAEQAAGPEALCRPRQVAVFLKALASPFVTRRSFSEAPPQPSSTQPCPGGSDALLSLFPHL